jgi:hypothetical protein
MFKHVVPRAAAAAAVLMLTACQPANMDVPAPASPVVGGDTDAQGCKPSAGYQWSGLLGRCIRVFEDGQRFDPTPQNADQTLAAYVVGLDAAASQVELFWPGMPDAVMLQQDSASQSFKGGQGMELIAADGQWRLQRDGQALFVRVIDGVVKPQ